MEFDIELRGSSKAEGGMMGSIQAQLEEIGGQATLISEGTPYRVDTGDDQFYFEVRVKYHIVLS